MNYLCRTFAHGTKDQTSFRGLAMNLLELKPCEVASRMRVAAKQSSKVDGGCATSQCVQIQYGHRRVSTYLCSLTSREHRSLDVDHT